MQVPGLNLKPKPVRKVRSDTELRQFILEGEIDLREAAQQWVRFVARRSIDEVITAGNPPHYALEIDGATGSAGKVKTGRAFKGGSIEQATRAVRASFVGADLATIANNLKPQLLRLIAETFPRSRTKMLQTQWSWWVQQDGLLTGSKRTPSRRLGNTVPDSVSLYDVLWLAPDVHRKDGGNYAWFANRLALQRYGHKWNLIKTSVTVKRGKQAWLTHGFKVRRRLRGFMAEAARKMRGTRSQQQAGPVNIQVMFLRQFLNAADNAATRKGGLPTIRVAFRRSLARPVSVTH
jgi:hypothetical protein